MCSLPYKVHCGIHSSLGVVVTEGVHNVVSTQTVQGLVKVLGPATNRQLGDVKGQHPLPRLTLVPIAWVWASHARNHTMGLKPIARRERFDSALESQEPRV